MTKKALSFILVFTIIFSLAVNVSASASTDTYEKTSLDRANTLKDLGLFKGTDNGFDLDRSPTRTEAIVMLLRMLGEEQAALNSSYTDPFTDVPSWAVKYVSYAYNKGYANGISATAFGSSSLVTPEQFITFMLRALGYDDRAGDFMWNESINYAEWLGLAGVSKYQDGSDSFLRSDCIDIMYSFLTASKKGTTTTLAEALADQNVISRVKAEKYGLIQTPASDDSNTRFVDARDLLDFLGYTAYTKAEEKMAGDIVSSIITPSMSDREKALVIHDYIINNTVYGYPTNDEDAAYRAEGVFKYNEAVCAGYSSAFLVMAHVAGLEATYVSVKSDKMHHAWNKVKIDGVWYHVDVTWDDPIGGSLRYKYFLITDDEISKDHDMNYVEKKGNEYIR